MSQLNVYYCDTCKRGTVTKQDVEGTTSMMIRCGHCDSGVAQSSMLAAKDERAIAGLIRTYGEPTHEWYKPTTRQARNKGPQMFEHAKLGGLFLRKIGDEAPAGEVSSLARPPTGGNPMTPEQYLRSAITAMADEPKLSTRALRASDAIKVAEAFMHVGLLTQDELDVWAVEFGSAVVSQ